MSEIIIASVSIDEPTYSLVAEKLTGRGFDVFLYLADRVVSGADLFAISTAPNGDLNFSYNGESKILEDMDAGWYRHPGLLGIDYTDKAKQMSIETEIRSLQEALWQRVPDEAWLNSPTNNERAQTKLTQLATASSLGFSIPQTVVSNNWESIDESVQGDDIIIKMPRGLLYEDNQAKVVYSTRPGPETLNELHSASPFPAIFQRYISKSREWRVTVVGDQTFDAAIYTDEDAKDDWRKHQLTDSVTFKKEIISDDIKDKCRQFLGHYGLRYGAFDFIEDQDGKVTFLECNPNGQYVWLEESLGLPISDAIVDELAKIATH